MFSAALASAALAAVAAEYPGHLALLSPDGTWQVTDQDPAGNEAPHRLILRHPGGPKRTLYRYGRHVLVTWSPDSRRIAITDYAGSNVTECIVVDAQTLHQTDVMADAARTSPKIKKLLRNFHSYFECPGWTSATTLKVRVSGYGDDDPKGAMVTITYHFK